jgi:NADPH-dependent 2,4-dienoyl-CoA reductase/sulfur reductase-like enzyme/ferredoxin
MYPGFVAGYFLFAQFGPWGLLGFPLVSLGVFETLRTFTRVSPYLLVVGFGLTAICTYYAYATGTIAHGLLDVFGIAVPPPIVSGAQAVVIGGALAVFVASIRLEYAYQRAIAEEQVTRVGGADDLRERVAASTDAIVTERSGGRSFHAAPQQTLLEAIESAQLTIESGCRMGMCGADPILIVSGAEHLAPAAAEERSTLARLGLASNVRLACSCRTTGPVQIDIDPKTVRAAPRDVPASSAPPVAAPSLRVVIIGNGAAGMSAAEQLRRGDPAASITVIGNEPFAFYNRMGIGRAIYGRSALQGLTLLDDAWYERERVDVFLNTHAARIARDERTVELATGERLPYDKLVIATGSSAVRPDISGAALPGSFVLRSAEDAADLRRYVQTNGARRAVVLGGGVLGVEASDALRRVGLTTTIVARGKRLMERSLDDTAAAIMQSFLEGLGIIVRANAVAASIDGDARVRGVTLADGSTIATDIVVSCIGVVPNADLARAAGLAVERGIIVDAQMRTSDPDIFAAGDVAEFAHAPAGLWPVGKKHGEVAAAAILGQTTAYRDVRAFSHVKLTGIDVRYFGSIDEPVAGALEFSDRSADGREWRTVRFVENRVAGAVVVGFADTTQKLAVKVQSGAPCDAAIAALRAGDWSFPD